jgi:hypothetical protein
MMRWFISILYRGFDSRGYSMKMILVMVFFQKILRVNGDVQWPVHWSSRVLQPDNIQRGTESPGYMPCCNIDGRNGIVLGENVTIGPGVSIISQNHDVCDFDRYIAQGPIRIGRNSWIGAGAILLPGVELGEHTVVGAGAVVTKSFVEGNQVIAGNPARVVKKLGEYVRR